MASCSKRTAAVVVFFACLGLLACDAATLSGLGLGSPKPTVAIQSPTNAAQFVEGDAISVLSTSKDPGGIVRVELAVDGAAVSSDTPPVLQGQVSFALVQKWKATSGAHTLSVRAFSANVAVSDPAMVTVNVASSPSGVSSGSSQSLLAEAGITPMPTWTPLPTPTISVPTSTRRPPTLPPPSPTIVAPPGVYAVSIRIDPPQPKRGSPPTFYVTFLNNTGRMAYYTWYIKIYGSDKPSSIGETSKLPDTFPAGRYERAAPADWKIGLYGGCEGFLARVFSYDRATNQTTEFARPEAGGGPSVAFLICP